MYPAGSASLVSYALHKWAWRFSRYERFVGQRQGQTLDYPRYPTVQPDYPTVLYSFIVTGTMYAVRSFRGM